MRTETYMISQNLQQSLIWFLSLLAFATLMLYIIVVG
jgi:hypothetical protein